MYVEDACCVPGGVMHAPHVTGGSALRQPLKCGGMPLQAHADEITGLAFWPGSDMVATCSRDCSLKVWHLGTGARPSHPLSAKHSS